MRKLVSYNDAGIGNRICCLLGGLITAENLNCEFTLSWPKTNSCDCSFNKLFDSKINLIEEHIYDIHEKHKDWVYITSYVFDECKFPKTLKQNQESIKKLGKMKENILYTHYKIAGYLDEKKVLEKLKLLSINKNILNIVNNFCSRNNINNKVYGIHLRRTDFKFDVNGNQKLLELFKKETELKFFICSDDKETETLFQGMKNVIIYPKTSYVEKLYKGSKWVEKLSDKEGRLISYNVNRSEETIIQGFIDLLILSRTNLEKYKDIGSSKYNSTFFALAKLYNKISL